MTDTNQKLREALRRIKHESASLADAQVIALEALALPTADENLYLDGVNVEHNNAPAVPQGWKLVPIEPTREMLMAALDVENASYDNHQHVLTEQWKDMLAAAPVKNDYCTWLPIESVPKNGSQIILRKGDRIGAAMWVIWPATPEHEYGEGWTVGFDGNTWDGPNAPTHWTPLPHAGNAAAPASAPAQDEPFGHFRVEPFGWTDCAKDDEGAIALYERPQEVGLTDEEAGPILKSVFDAGWAACRDSELVGDNAKEFAWDMSGDEITERAIAALRAKGGK